MQDQAPMPKRKLPKIFYVILAIFALFLLYDQFLKPSPKVAEINATELYQAIEKGEVKTLKIDPANRQTSGEFSDGRKFKATVANTEGLETLAISKGVLVSVASKPLFSWPDLLSATVPLIIILGFIFLVLKRQKGGGPLSLFGKSLVNFIAPEKIDVNFSDVAGCDEAKEEVRQLVDFLENPARYEKFGLRPPRGILLIGPPGCGKTMLARALAKEVGVAFGSLSGSDFVEMLVGVGAARVRNLFAQAFVQAKARGRCILFIDEIDAIGKRRRAISNHTSHDEQEQTLTALLAEMDGFDSASGIIIIGATNNPEVLDPALTRAGRFDRKVIIGLPDIKGRQEILKVHIRKIRALADDVDLQKIVRLTPGFSGADLENLINEAGLQAVKQNKEAVSQNDFYEAIDKVLWGKPRKIALSEAELKRCAYHELGHALTAFFTRGKSAIRKVTIISRGMSLGATHFHAPEEEHLKTEKDCRDWMAVAMGGRAAEMLNFGGDSSSGVSEDLAQATEIARDMICKFGMSEKAGIARFDQGGNIFLGIEGALNCSEATKRIIDEEIDRLLKEAYARAFGILTTSKPLMDFLVFELRMKESLTGGELKQLIDEFKSCS